MKNFRNLLLIANVFFLFLLIIVPQIHAQAEDKFVGTPTNTDGSSVLSCGSVSCVKSLQKINNVTDKDYKVILSAEKNTLIMNWEKPFGNFIINNMTLYLTMKGCDSLVKPCSQRKYFADIEVWNGVSWIPVAEETLSNTEKTYEYSVKNKMMLDSGQYRAKITKNSKTADYIFIDQARLKIDYTNLDKKPSRSANGILSYFRENLLFWRRFFIGFISTLFVILIFVGLKKSKRAKKIFKFMNKEKEEDLELDRKLEKYRSLKSELEQLNMKLSSIEASRKETQKKYYTRAIDENTFKQIMQKYEQSRTEIKNEIEEIKRAIKKLG